MTPSPSGSGAPFLRVTGRLTLLTRRPANSSPLSFWGAGFGITASVGKHLDGRLTVAWPVLSVPGVDAGTMHIYFSLGAQF